MSIAFEVKSSQYVFPDYVYVRTDTGVISHFATEGVSLRRIPNRFDQLELVSAKNPDNVAVRLRVPDGYYVDAYITSVDFLRYHLYKGLSETPEIFGFIYNCVGARGFTLVPLTWKPAQKYVSDVLEIRKRELYRIKGHGLVVALEDGNSGATFDVRKVDATTQELGKKLTFSAEPGTLAFEKIVATGEEFRDFDRKIALKELDLHLRSRCVNSWFVSEYLTATGLGLEMHVDHSTHNNILIGRMPLSLLGNPVFRYPWGHLGDVKHYSDPHSSSGSRHFFVGVRAANPRWSLCIEVSWTSHYGENLALIRRDWNISCFRARGQKALCTTQVETRAEYSAEQLHLFDEVKAYAAKHLKTTLDQLVVAVSVVGQICEDPLMFRDLGISPNPVHMEYKMYCTVDELRPPGL